MLCCVSAFADGGVNTGYSPYSIYGLGRMGQRGTAYSQSMGGVGVANRNTRYINTLNPAAVTARDSLAFMADFSVAGTNSYYSQGSKKSVDNTFNINSFVMSFPIWKSSAFMIGINPFSGLGYNFSENNYDENLLGDVGNIVDYSTGSGSLYEIYFAAGATFWKRLSVGAQLNGYFGNMTRTSARTFSREDVASVYHAVDMHLGGVTGKFGVQYEQPIKGGHKLLAGATYRIRTKLSGQGMSLGYTSQSSVLDTLGKVDTVNYRSAALPAELSVGLAYKYQDKLHVEFNYTMSDWIKSGIDQTKGLGVKGFEASVAQSFNVGIEYTPNRNDVRYYMKRCTYRVGGYYSHDYYKYNGVQVTAAAFTAGITFPVFRWSNGISVGMEFGQRGKLANNMVKETFVNFSIGLNIYDIWFIKHRYE